MSYEFSFEKKSFPLMLAGAGIVVVLMFLIGFFVGVRLQPVGAISVKAESVKLEKPKLELKKAAGEKPAEEAAPAKKAGEGKEAPSESTAAAEWATPAAAAYAIQLGAFHDAVNAKKMADEFKERGYKPFVFKALDSLDHPWHTVRLGPYPDLAAASHAATELNNKEGIQAFVRPANAL